MNRTLPLAALPLVGVMLLIAGCGKPPATGGGFPPPPVGVATPISRVLPVTREFTGRIEAIQSVDLRTRVGGTITKVLVEDGAAVTKGQLLFEIDPAPLEAALAKAKAELARGDARLAQAQQQFARAKKLVAEKIVSQQAYDDAESAVATASAEQAAAAAGLANAELDLSHAHITAPISGRFGRVLSTVGNLAQATGQAPGTLLGNIVAIDPVYAVFDLDETLWRSIGTRLRASADAKGVGEAAVPVHVALAGETGFPHPGAVSFVDNQIDTASGSIRIRALLANTDGALTPGAFARIQLEVAPPRPVLLINEKTVLAQLTTRYVLTVDDKGGTAFRPVQLGETSGALRVVTSGLAPTDSIAVNNLTKIFFPGMPVAPLPASMETTENVAEAESRERGAGKPEADKPKPAAEGTKP